MVAQRRSTSTPDLAERLDEVNLGPRRTLRSGMQAWVLFPGRRTKKLARFLYGDERGELTFTDPRNGGRRTVKPDAVKSIPRSQAPAR
jgi:hypothetical protein